MGFSKDNCIKKNNSRLCGYSEISSINPKETVMVSDGDSFSEVKYIIKGSSDDLVQVDINGSIPIFCTSDQEFLVCKGGEINTDYVAAKDLTKDDFLAIPVNMFPGESSYKYKGDSNFWTFLGIFAGLNLISHSGAYSGLEDQINLEIESKRKDIITSLEQILKNLKLPYCIDPHNKDDWEVRYRIGLWDYKNEQLLAENEKNLFNEIYKSVHYYIDHTFQDVVNWNIFCVNLEDLEVFWNALKLVASKSCEKKKGNCFEIFHKDNVLLISMIYHKLFHKDIKITKEARGGLDYRLYIDEECVLSRYDEIRNYIWTQVKGVEKYVPKGDIIHKPDFTTYDLVLDEPSDFIVNNVLVRGKILK